MNAPEAEIRNAMFELVAHPSPSPITPPITFKNAAFDTPHRSSSVSQKGIEQTHDKVGQRILEEPTMRMYYDVEGFER
jgi:hypothetical protein